MVQFTGSHKAVDDCREFTTTVRTGEQMVVPTQVMQSFAYLGRKNYLFAGSHQAAQRAAMFYSLLATCKNYNVNPYNWLHDILNKIADHPINRIKELLPQNWIDKSII